MITHPKTQLILVKRMLFALTLIHNWNRWISGFLVIRTDAKRRHNALSNKLLKLSNEMAMANVSY